MTSRRSKLACNAPFFLHYGKRKVQVKGRPKGVIWQVQPVIAIAPLFSPTLMFSSFMMYVRYDGSTFHHALDVLSTSLTPGVTCGFRT